MKRSFLGTSLAITENKHEFNIEVEVKPWRNIGGDFKGFKKKFKAPVNSKSARIKALNSALDEIKNNSVLSFQADVLKSKHYKEWLAKLRIDDTV